jgi:hypothetical protein
MRRWFIIKFRDRFLSSYLRYFLFYILDGLLVLISDAQQSSDEGGWNRWIVQELIETICFLQDLLHSSCKDPLLLNCGRNFEAPSIINVS